MKNESKQLSKLSEIKFDETYAQYHFKPKFDTKKRTGEVYV